MTMVNLDQRAWTAIRQEIQSGESVVWAGRPELKVIFNKEDLFAIPFSLLWGGFALFWEAGVTGILASSRYPYVHIHVPLFLALWGIPFVLVGQYFIWGRFFYAAWLKEKTFYAVTDRRVLVVQNGFKRQMASAYLDALPNLTKEVRGDGIGTIRFSPSLPMAGASNRGWGALNGLAVGAAPIFVDVKDADSLYNLILDQRDKLRTAR